MRSWPSRQSPGSYGALPTSSGALPHSPGLCRHSPGLYRLYHTPDHPRFVPTELRRFPGVTPVVPIRAKDEGGKAILPDHPGHLGDINYFIPSGVECRMFPDHPRRCRQSYGCTPVVSGRTPVVPDHPGRLPGLCWDVSETVALIILH
jgi:hypothetical protein